MFQRILVPLDGSSRAERAIPVAARIARATHGSVLLLRVAAFPAQYGLSLYQAYASSSPLLEEDITERVLDGTTLPLLVVRPQELDSQSQGS